MSLAALCSCRGALRTRAFARRHCKQPRAARLSAASFDALGSAEQSKLEAFLDLLLEENKKQNLTSVRDRAAAFEKHICDSLALLSVIEASHPLAAQRSLSLLDVGSGPGLPGIVLAIARPQWRVTCLDSLRKRMLFVDDAADALSLDNVRTAWGRCEDLAHDERLRERFDVVTARAVAEMAVLAEYCLPFVRVGGVWVAAKGSDIQEEVSEGMAAVALLGGEYLGTEPVESFSPVGQRTAVLVKKVARSAAWYPRQAGTPKNKPLRPRA